MSSRRRAKFLLAAVSSVAYLTIGSAAYLGLIASGWSRGLEYKLYDRYLQLCSKESQDQKIVVVGLTEEDIHKIGHFPVSDEILGDLLLKVRKQNPRVIGLDLHRNVQTGGSASASQEIASVFRDTPNLIGVEKTTGGNPEEKPILAHPELAKAERTGSSEIIEDGDGVLRRGYLYVQRGEDEDEMIPSFGLAVALKYLEKENIEPTTHQSGGKSYLKLNKTIFRRLRKNSAFYSLDSIDNEQILINYCAAQKSFKRFTFSQVLSGDFPDGLFRNKVVLVGTRAETIDDTFKIPNYPKIIRGDTDLTFGVEAHGYLTSALINLALDSRASTIKFLPVSAEYTLLSLFLVGEAFLFIAWLNKRSRNFIGLAVFSLVQGISLLVLGWLVFLTGWWIPAVSYVYIVLIMTATCSFFIYIDKLKRENLLLEEKIEQKTQALEEAYKKIAAQEKMFVYQGLAKMFSHEIKNQTNALRANAQNCHGNVAEIKQILDGFVEDEDIEEGFVDPRQLCLKSLEQLLRIDDLVQKITLILGELDRDSGRESLKVSSLDINELLKIAVAESIQVKQVQALRVEENYEDSLPSLTGIKRHLERALENIVLNACDSVIQKSRESQDYVPILELVTKDKGDSIEVKIRDNGKGIAPDDRDKIFGMHWTTKGETGGKGLGLYFARNLIREHGGEINVESQPGEYAEFVIRLPKS